MAFGGGGFFGSGASQAETFGGAQQQANNQAIQGGGGAPIISVMDNRQASGKYAAIGSGPKINLTTTTTDHGAVQAGRDLGIAALDYGADTTENALYLAGSIAADGAGLTRRAMDQLADTFRWSQQQTGQTIERAIAFAEMSDKSEQGKAVGEVVKYAAWVGIAVAVAWALKGIKL